jgi:hypothetical protein
MVSGSYCDFGDLRVIIILRLRHRIRFAANAVTSLAWNWKLRMRQLNFLTSKKSNMRAIA